MIRTVYTHRIPRPRRPHPRPFPARSIEPWRRRASARGKKTREDAGAPTLFAVENTRPRARPNVRSPAP